MCLLPYSHDTQPACHPLDLKIPHVLGPRSYITSGRIQQEEMQQAVAGRAGRESANATHPSCAEVEHTVRTQLADSRVYQQHHTVMFATRPMRHSEIPASEPLFSSTQYLVFPSSREHSIGTGIKFHTFQNQIVPQCL